MTPWERRPALRLTLIGLVLLIAACGSPNPDNEVGIRVPTEFTTQRPRYDVSRAFHQLIRPHFLAASRSGDLVEAKGTPDLVLERNGKVKIRLRHEGEERYLALLALESELLGEHPVHKLYRLRAMGIPIESRLEEGLSSTNSDSGLFHSIQFEYIAGGDTSGVISEVFPDGTFLAIPSGVPSEWRRDEDGLPPPTHFHVNPRALSVAQSGLANEFEAEILSLPFDDQRYPSPELARKQCGVYDESLRASLYRDVLLEVGYRFTPAHVANDAPSPYGERLSRLLRQGAGDDTSYFGFEGYWIAARAHDLGAPWLGECDTAGAPRAYPAAGGQRGYYVTTRRSLEPDKTRRYRIIRLSEDGAGEPIYTAPGIILMARPLPSNGDPLAHQRGGLDSTPGRKPTRRQVAVGLPGKHG